MDGQKQLTADNAFQGMSLAIILFGFGLFLTVGTYGLFAIIGIPLMLAGIIVPFWEANLAHRGRNWFGRRARPGAV